jgi:hypothetical protein
LIGTEFIPIGFQGGQLMNNRDFLLGAGVGAALTYMFDPVGGARRRALLRDKAVRVTRKTREGLDGKARDVANRLAGAAAAARGRLTSEAIDDARLFGRVRAQLGRVSTHPRALEVDARNGEVTVRGPILAREVDAVLAAIAAVRGVRSVINQLEIHASGDRLPSLQGQGPLAERRIAIPRGWLPRRSTLLRAIGLGAAGAYVATQAGRGGARRQTPHQPASQ